MLVIERAVQGWAALAAPTNSAQMQTFRVPYPKPTESELELALNKTPT